MDTHREENYLHCVIANYISGFTNLCPGLLLSGSCYLWFPNCSGLGWGLGPPLLPISEFYSRVVFSEVKVYDHQPYACAPALE